MSESEISYRTTEAGDRAFLAALGFRPLPQVTEPPPLLTAREAAAYARCHTNTIYEAAKAGLLRHRHVGRKKLFTHDDLDAWTKGES